MAVNSSSFWRWIPQELSLVVCKFLFPSFKQIYQGIAGDLYVDPVDVAADHLGNTGITGQNMNPWTSHTVH